MAEETGIQRAGSPTAINGIRLIRNRKRKYNYSTKRSYTKMTKSKNKAMVLPSPDATGPKIRKACPTKGCDKAFGKTLKIHLLKKPIISDNPSSKRRFTRTSYELARNTCTDSKETLTDTDQCRKRRTRSFTKHFPINFEETKTDTALTLERFLEEKNDDSEISDLEFNKTPLLSDFSQNLDVIEKENIDGLFHQFEQQLEEEEIKIEVELKEINIEPKNHIESKVEEINVETEAEEMQIEPEKLTKSEAEEIQIEPEEHIGPNVEDIQIETEPSIRAFHLLQMPFSMSYAIYNFSTPNKSNSTSNENLYNWRKTDLNDHIQNLEEPDVPKQTIWMCSVDGCEKAFDQRENLTQHSWTHFEKPFECDQCQERFESETSLDNHIEKLGVHNLPKQTIWNCSVDGCRKAFNLQDDLTQHSWTHSKMPHLQKLGVSYLPKQTTWMCSVESCGRTFKRRVDLIRHIRAHSGKRPFMCSQCEKKFATEKRLQRHILEKHNPISKPTSGSVEGFGKIVSTPYMCSQCEKKFATKKRLQRHIFEKHNPISKPISGSVEGAGQILSTPYNMCSQCEKKFATEKRLQKHILEKHNPISKPISGSVERLGKILSIPYMCSQCEEKFSTEDHLQKHILEKHNPESKPISCSFEGCGKIMKSVGGLKRHIKLKHIGEKSLGKENVKQDSSSRKHSKRTVAVGKSKNRLRRKIVLKPLLEMNANEKKFKCTVEGCNRTFLRKAWLIMHSKVHSGGKQCKQRFRRKVALKRHLTIRPNDGNFICPVKVCGKVLPNKTALSRHLKIHSGIKPFQCECKQRFLRRDNMNKHKREHCKWQ